MVYFGRTHCEPIELLVGTFNHSWPRVRWGAAAIPRTSFVKKRRLCGLQVNGFMYKRCNFPPRKDNSQGQLERREVLPTPVKVAGANDYYCPRCRQRGYIFPQDVFHHMEKGQPECQGELDKVKVFLDNGIFGTITLDNLSDRRVEIPQERVKVQFILFGYQKYGIITFLQLGFLLKYHLPWILASLSNSLKELSFFALLNIALICLASCRCRGSFLWKTGINLSYMSEQSKHLTDRLPLASPGESRPEIQTFVKLIEIILTRSVTEVWSFLLSGKIHRER